MDFNRLKRGALALCAAAAFAGAGGAQAAGFPDRPVNVFVPTAAGGTVDIVARIMAEKLAPELGQPVVVINKPGAGGVVGTQAFLREPQDGYTVLFTANSNQLIVPWCTRMRSSIRSKTSRRSRRWAKCPTCCA